MSKVHASIRYCLQCGDSLAGRSDKKFCSDWCRNEYHLEKKGLNPLVKQINQILKRNHDILQKVLGNGAIAEIDKRILNEMDFNFYYHTHYKKDKKGNTIYYCYEYAFRLINNASVVICKGSAE